MSENRDLSKDSLSNMKNYHTKTAVINFLYAKKYNYKFIYYYYNTLSKNNSNTKRDATCNSKFGGRASSYCKVISMYYALSINNTDDNYIYKYIFIDSDAIFSNFNLSMTDFLNQAEYDTSYIKNKDIIFSSDKPDTNPIFCGGWFLFTQNKLSLCFLRKWWNEDNKECKYWYKYHAYEQSCLQHQIQLHPFINTLTYNWMSNSWDMNRNRNQFVRHIGNLHQRYRTKTFVEYLKKNLDINEEKYIEILTEIKNKNVIEIKNINIAQEIGFNEYNPDDCDKILHANIKTDWIVNSSILPKIKKYYPMLNE